MSCQAGPGIEPGPSALKASALPIELTWQIKIGNQMFTIGITAISYGGAGESGNINHMITTRRDVKKTLNYLKTFLKLLYHKCIIASQRFCSTVLF